MRKAALCVLVLATIALSGCHRKQARLVFTRREGTHDRLYVAEPTGSRAPEPALTDLPGDVFSGVAIDAGRAMLVVVRNDPTHAALWRINAERQLRVDRRIADIPVMLLVAASHDGRIALLNSTTSNANEVVVFREGHNPPITSLATFRYASGADLSADGHRALISGTPTSCTETSLGRCPLELFGVDLTSDTPAMHAIAVSARANYQPRFIPGTHDNRVLYQTTELDPSPGCAADLNHCWHDLVTRDFAGHEAPQPLRSGVVGPAYSPGGTHLAFLSYTEPEAACPALPCSHQSLYVMTPGRDDARRLAVADVAIFVQRYWSADDRWLAYHSEDRNTHARSIKTIHADGAPGRSLGDGRVIAWVMQ